MSARPSARAAAPLPRATRAAKKNPAEAGLEFRDERAQRVWELVPVLSMRNAYRRFRVSHKKLRVDIPAKEK
jgi:hypothetical protein